MGSVMRRRRKDGSVSYTAQVRIKRGGKALLNEAETFDSERAAREWIAKRERALRKPGALDAIVARQPQMTVGQAIERYERDKRSEIGKTKAQVLRAILSYDIASVELPSLRSSHIVAFARTLAEDREPATVGTYLSHLSPVLRVARVAWGVEVDPQAMKDAAGAASHLGLTGKSKQRSRRPTLDELDRLMAHFEDRHIRGRSLPMHHVVAFAIFSTRRQEEIIRIRWADLEPGRVLVRDMKHPGEKVGNDVWCELVPEAERIVRAQPRADERIFPYSTDAISASFTRACQLLGVEDLRFHDLRHEGVTRLFEMGRTVPLAASVSGHRSWASLKRYTHVRGTGDKFDGWMWLDVVAPLPQQEVS